MNLKTKIMVYITGALLILLVLSRIWSYVMGSWSCGAEWKESGMEYKYSLRGGCMVKPKDHWIPAKNYRY